MSADPNWDDLIPRLEDDLRRRKSSELELSDDGAWKIAEQLLRSRARIVALNYPDLQANDVEDLVQSTLLKMQSRVTLRRLRAARSSEGYVYVILRNAAQDLLRRRQVERKLFERLDGTEADVAEEPRFVEQAEAQSVISDVLTGLSPSELELLQMRFWRNMTIAEIAKETHLTYSTVAVRFFRLLRRLRDQVK